MLYAEATVHDDHGVGPMQKSTVVSSGTEEEMGEKKDIGWQRVSRVSRVEKEDEKGHWKLS